MYNYALPPKHLLSLSEDKRSPNSMASIPDVTILWYTRKDRDKTFVWQIIYAYLTARTKFGPRCSGSICL